MTLDVAEALELRGLLRREDIPPLAADLLERGHDTETIRRLAGLTGEDLNPAAALFRRVLEEMGRPQATLDEAATAIARHIAEAILAPGAPLRLLAADGARLAVAFDYPAVLMAIYTIADCYELPELFPADSVDARLVDYARELLKV